jgi:prolyl-tRNA editing enzyme YbaK/EbsC (Cys-tRNA(Pro) deacylase)
LPIVSIEQAVYQQLDQLGVPYRVIEIDPDYADTAAFCERYGFSPTVSVNCIVVASKTGERKYAVCLVQATRRLDVNRKVRGLIGARKVSFAPAEDTVAVTGMAPGGVTPFGLPPELPIYVDAPVMDLEEIVLGGGGGGPQKRGWPGGGGKRAAGARGVRGGDSGVQVGGVQVGQLALGDRADLVAGDPAAGLVAGTLRALGSAEGLANQEAGRRRLVAQVVGAVLEDGHHDRHDLAALGGGLVVVLELELPRVDTGRAEHLA